jgi:hypothetical protein
MMTYDVLIQPQSDGAYRATALGWADLSVVGENQQVALNLIRRAIQERLEQGVLVRVEVETTPAEHPWARFMGMWKDDPTFDDLTAQMAAYRRELDAAAEA